MATISANVGFNDILYIVSDSPNINLHAIADAV